MAELEAGTLYDINKELVKQTDKELKGKALYNKITNTLIPFLDDNDLNNYFMLLCHEKRDYTIFHLGEAFLHDGQIVDEFRTCLINRGTVYSIERTEDNVALEIWVNYNNSEMVCYYFFPYDNGVIEI